MKVLKRYLKEGKIVLKIEYLDDLWHLYNIITPEDIVVSRTTRRVKIGDKMPEFSLADPNGVEFAYRHNGKRVLVVVFMSASQKQSTHAIADIENLSNNHMVNQEKTEVLI